MRIDMNVPFAEKDLAKQLGARWDGFKKCWYIVDMEDLTPFMKWFPEYLTKPYSNNSKPSKKSKKRQKQQALQGNLKGLHKQNMQHFKSI